MNCRMSQAYKGAIDALMVDISVKESEIAAKQAELAPLKLAANALAKLVGITEPFADVNSSAATTGPRVQVIAWRADHFFNRPLTDCVIEILEARKSAGKEGPASMDEIFDTLKSGNFRFGGSGSDENSKRAVKISLTKNNAHFSKIGEDSFGLKKWYGAIKSVGKKSNGKGADSDTESDSAPVAEQAVPTNVDGGEPKAEGSEPPSA